MLGMHHQIERTRTVFRAKIVVSFTKVKIPLWDVLENHWALGYIREIMCVMDNAENAWDEVKQW